MDRSVMIASGVAGGVVAILLVVAVTTWMAGSSTDGAEDAVAAPVAAEPVVEEAPAAVEEEPLPKLEPIEQDPHNPVLPPTLRLADREGLGQRGKRIVGYESLDVKPTANFQMDVFQDKGQYTINRLTIDMDRDGKLDEAWVFDARGVVREVSESDDGTWSRTERWDGGGWVAE